MCPYPGSEKCRQIFLLKMPDKEARLHTGVVGAPLCNAPSAPRKKSAPEPVQASVAYPVAAG